MTDGKARIRGNRVFLVNEAGKEVDLGRLLDVDPATGIVDFVPEAPFTMKNGDTLTFTSETIVSDEPETFAKLRDGRNYPDAAATSAMAAGAAMAMGHDFWQKFTASSRPLTQQEALEELRKQREFEANHVTPAEVDEALESIRRSASALDERPES